MKTIPLGNSGFQVSAFCLGTLHYGWAVSPEMSYRLLDIYLEAGGTFLDTANIYGKVGIERVGGLSEVLLGKWMSERSNRSKVFLASKIGFDYTGTLKGLSARQIIEECNKSLARLQTDFIDLYYAHLDDRQTPLEETQEAFERLVQAGKIRAIGASNFSAWRLAEARLVSQISKWATYCCIQQRYSYARPQPGASFTPQVVATEELLDYCGANGVTMLAYSPLLGGAYSRQDKPLSPQYLGGDTDARLAALRVVSHQLGVDPNQVVLAWMLQSDPAIIPVMTGSRPEQLQQNLKALKLDLSKDQMALLNQASAIKTL